MGNLMVERSIWIEASRERVWQALTEPAELAQWFLPPAMGMQLQRDDDGKLKVMMGEMGVPVAVVGTLEPPQRVIIQSLPERQLKTTYTLAEEGDGTRVTVTLTGFETLPAEAAQERLAPSGAAWEKALENLRAHVGGQALPHPQGWVTALFGYRREAPGKLSVERSIWINAPRERVWQAITDPKQVQAWFSPTTEWRATGLAPGEKLYTVDPETGNAAHTQIIDVVEAPRLLITHSAPPELAHASIWLLEEENGGTRLTLTNSGYELEPDEARHNAVEQNGMGLGMMLENLQAQVEGRELAYPWGF